MNKKCRYISPWREEKKYFFGRDACTTASGMCMFLRSIVKCDKLRPLFQSRSVCQSFPCMWRWPRAVVSWRPDMCTWWHPGCGSNGHLHSPPTPTLVASHHHTAKHTVKRYLVIIAYKKLLWYWFKEGEWCQLETIIKGKAKWAKNFHTKWN